MRHSIGRWAEFIACTGAAVVFVIAPITRAAEPPSPAALLDQAERARLQLRWEEASSLLRQVLEHRESDPALAATAQLRLGLYALDHWKYPDAEAEFRRAIDSAGDSAASRMARVHLVDALRGQERFEEAQRAAQSLLDASSESPELGAWARLKMGQIIVDRGMRIGAIPMFEVVVAQADEFPAPGNWARARLAEVLVQEARRDEGIALAEQVIADHAQGRATAEQAAWAWFWKGDGLKVAKQYDEARSAFASVTDLAEPYPKLAYLARIHLGDACRFGGPGVREQALAEYRRALEIAQGSRLGEERENRALIALAKEMRRFGNREGAIAWMRSGIGDPSKLSVADGELVKNIMGFMRPGEAESWARYLAAPVEEPDPTVAWVGEEFGVISPGVFDNAGSPPAHQRLWLADCYRQQGRLEDAIRIYDEVISETSDYGEIAYAQDGIAKSAYAVTINTSDAALRGQWKLVALTSAKLAAEAWSRVVDRSTGCDSHSPLESAIDVLWDVGLYNDAINLAEGLAAEYRLMGDPRKTAFASMKLSEAYLGQSRNSEAAAVALALWERFSDSQDVIVAELCARSMFIAHIAYTNLGEVETASLVLKKLDASRPLKYSSHIERAKSRGVHQVIRR